MALTDPEPIVGRLPLWHQFQHIGGNLTPATVSSILAEADIGYPQRFVDLFHELRQKPSALHHAMQTRELAISGLDWTIETPPGLENDAQAKDIAADATDMVRGISNLPELFAHMTGEGLGFGHAHSEIMWGLDRPRRLVVTRFENVASRRFIFRQSDGALRFRDCVFSSLAPTDGIDLCETFPDKFIRRRVRVNGDVPVREGLGRLLVWASLFQNWTLKDWLLFAEIAWKPWRVGKYQKAASREDIAALESILQRMTSTGEAVIPETVDIEVNWPGNPSRGGSSSHAEMWNMLAALVAQAILGQTLTSSQGQIGSQALGKVHNEIRKDIRESDAKDNAGAFTRWVLGPFTRANYGDNAPVPLFRFLTEDAADITALAASVKDLSDAGMRTIPEGWVRDEIGIPAPVEGEPCIGDAKAEPGSALEGDGSEERPGEDEDEQGA